MSVGSYRNVTDFHVDINSQNNHVIKVPCLAAHSWFLSRRSTTADSVNLRSVVLVLNIGDFFNVKGSSHLSPTSISYGR